MRSRIHVVSVTLVRGIEKDLLTHACKQNVMRMSFFGGGRPSCLLVCVVHFRIRRCLDVPTVCLWRVLPVSEPQVCGGVQREAHWGYEWNHLAHAGCCSGTHGPEEFSHGEKWHYSCCWTAKCQEFVTFVDLSRSFMLCIQKKTHFCTCSSWSPCQEKERTVTWHPCQSRARATWTWAMVEQTTLLIMG